MSQSDPFRYDSDIAKALVTPGGHLSIGRGGFSLYYENSTLSSYDETVVKNAAIRAGLPVIDSRTVPLETAVTLVVQGPMIAVNKLACPPPWHGFSYAPLAVVATLYRRAGAHVFNVEEAADEDVRFFQIKAGPFKDLLDAWHRSASANALAGDQP